MHINKISHVEFKTEPKCNMFVYLVAEEMDLNKNGKVNLKEFLFSMIKWAGLEPEEDESNEASP